MQGTVWRCDPKDPSTVREWNDVVAEARRANLFSTIDLGGRFGICVEKGSELPDGDPWLGTP
eukprot:262111-Lingulodinium_polyedra.AAC.1